MQYNRDAAGTLDPLPAPCVDTGMGLERVAAVVQGKLSNYDTDLFQPLIAAVGRRDGQDLRRDPKDDVSLRVVADHLRAMTFLIADGVLPGNEGRGYVLRKIMRRAMRHVKHLGVDEPCLFELTRAVVDRMAGAFPELLNHARLGGPGGPGRGAALRHHPEAGHRRVRPDRRQARRRSARSPAPMCSSSTTPTGCRWTSPRSWRRSAGLAVDVAGFERELTEQQERARAASKMGAVKGDPVFMKVLEDEGKTDFLGYTSLSVENARVLAVVKDGQVDRRLDAGDEGGIVLDRTPVLRASRADRWATAA